MSSSIAIIGSGVVGLSCAIECAQAYEKVTIYSRSTPGKLWNIDASDKACSIWYPIMVAGDQERLDHWSAVTYDRLAQLASDPASGITAVEDIEIIDDPIEHAAPPSVIRNLPSFYSNARRGPLPPGSVGTWSFTSYIVAMPTYMNYLVAAARRRGVRFVSRDFQAPTDIEDLPERHVANCTGLGARHLFGDTNIRALKGHLIFFDPAELPFALCRYGFALMPRQDALVAGVLFIEEDDYDLTPRPANRDKILAELRSWQAIDALNLNLGDINLGNSAIRQELVGLRPYRSVGVRFEVERLGTKLILHNYGHGGSGVSLSWGCAADAVISFREGLTTLA